jgi:hypothetical protein
VIPVCHRSDWEDIGHGVRIRRAYMDGVLSGVDYQHPSLNVSCNNGDRGDYIPCGTDELTVKMHWRLECASPLTLSPSLLCPICHHHGFVRDGKWVPA